MTKYLVLRDTREKENKGWVWKPSKLCAGTEDRTLKTGDYTIEGYEHVLAIERKGSISEWANNVTQKRFERELERLTALPCSFILLEFNMADILIYPQGSGIPKSRWYKLRFSGPFIIKRMVEMAIQYPTIHILPCGPHAKSVASSIFKRVTEHYDAHK